jgi:ParB/RepB/Spo0J family partition protein
MAKQPKRKSPSQNGTAVADPPRQVTTATVEAKDIHVDEISRSPYQVRQEFPEAEIEELAQTIAIHGQLTPIIVREVDGRCYELVEGERRWRAVKRLGLATIRAEVHRLSDAQARAIVLVSAIQRKGLNPIEEALAFRQAIDAGDAAGPTELARQLGLSQGHVSNRLRLLDLPEDWRGMVISGEITERHARAVLPYKDHPQILEDIREDLRQEISRDGEAPTVDMFESETVDAVVRNASRPVEAKHGDGMVWLPQRGRVKLFKPTPEQEAELGILELDGERRATNVELWEQLEAEFLAEQDGKPKKGSKAKKASPAEEARKEAERAEQFAKRLYEWKTNWQRYLIAWHLREEAGASDLLRVAMLALRHWNACDYRVSQFGDLEDTLKHTTGVKRVAGLSKAVLGLQEWDNEKVVSHVLACLFYEADYGPCEMAPPEDCEQLVEHFGINLASVWADEQAGPLSEAFWNLHTRDQLAALASELHATGVDTTGTKAAMVAQFMAYVPSSDDDANTAAAKSLPLPKEITKAKRPKA